MNKHIPVLIGVILTFLNFEINIDNSTTNIKENSQTKNIFDGTLGGGGYLFSILESWQNFDPRNKTNLKYWGCDLDYSAVENIQKSISEKSQAEKWNNLRAEEKKDGGNIDFGFELQKKHKLEINLKQASFVDYLKTFEDQSLDYIILDLGFCTNQFDYGRGFAYGQKVEEKTQGEEDLDQINTNISEEIIEKEMMDTNTKIVQEEFISREFGGTSEKMADSQNIELKQDEMLDKSLIRQNQLISRYKNMEDLVDLRFDETNGIPCWQMLKNTTPIELSKVIYNHSGEELSRRIAQNICQKIVDTDKIESQEDSLKNQKSKQEKGITVLQLRLWIEESIPYKFKKNTNKILSRVWQALRIWTNGEMESLEKFMNLAPSKIKIGGRIIIVDFHSLEDKLVTMYFRRLSKIMTDKFGNQIQSYKLITKRPTTPSEEEIIQNPASRSSSLRVLERVRE